MNTDPQRLLAQHTVLRTNDVAVFHAYMAGMEGRHTRFVMDDRPFDVELRHASLGLLDAGIHYASVRMVVATTRKRSDAYLLQFPLSGGIELEVDGREFSVRPGAAAVMSPGQTIRRTGLPGWTLALRIPADRVRAGAAARLGRPVKGILAFHPRVGPGAEDLLSYSLLLVDAIDRGQVAAGSSAASTLELGLVSLLLDVQPHTHASRIANAGAEGRATRVRRVVDYIERHLDQKLTVGNLATIAGCSVRSLQATFAETSGLSLSEYLLLRRLAAARAHLEAGGPDLRVADAALRAGFVHLARFSVRYRERFGESPSETRRRAIERRGDPTRR